MRKAIHKPSDTFTFNTVGQFYCFICYWAIKPYQEVALGDTLGSSFRLFPLSKSIRTILLRIHVNWINNTPLRMISIAAVGIYQYLQSHLYQSSPTTKMLFSLITLVRLITWKFHDYVINRSIKNVHETIIQDHFRRLSHVSMNE